MRRRLIRARTWLIFTYSRPENRSFTGEFQQWRAGASLVAS
jgi:hypothetical protein